MIQLTHAAAVPILAIVTALALAAAAPVASAQTTVRVHAADSLKPALDDIATEMRRSTGGKIEVRPTYAPAAALRDRIAGGEATDIYIATDIADARRVAEAARTRGPSVVFARRPGVGEHAFVVMGGAPPAAGEVAGFIRYGAGRAILTRHGYDVP
jgi:ABC-type molybdate transport system substrate-binding protein